MNYRDFFISAAIMILCVISLNLHAEITPKVSVDSNGRMVNSGTGEEVRYYGVNYTLPFAHGFRAAEALGIDHKKAIDRDVYHFSRMGINAFRVHLWDSELADSVGNLLSNRHLELLDYLIAQLEKRGIDIILTAQTNFGNGYPERNIDTGAFTYDYDKCSIHEDPTAIAAQQRYIAQLINHFNPYTDKSYGDDASIIAMEINNEPCHTSSAEQVKHYIDTMVKTMKDASWNKPILYNVSHNLEIADGYFDSDIDGTTYQWYPIGLVAGHERKGNFLPYVANYNIPFADKRNYDKLAKVVYEFDPADMIESYLYPAVARTFAGNGFQWATQFAYDPIDLARFNTEYQTHYLNLAYTPQKALGMRIAKHVMKNTRYSSIGYTDNYPVDTIFDYVTLSYKNNLALLNTPQEYIYTNSTGAHPIAADSLQHIAGYGSSPIVEYSGRGVYFLDKINDNDVWRLEILPDVFFTSDPFGKPSLHREVGHIINAEHTICIDIPGIGKDFYIKSISPEERFLQRAEQGRFDARPGVYLIGSKEEDINKISPDDKLGNIKINEYVMAPTTTLPAHINHVPTKYIMSGDSLVITAEAIAPIMPDSLIIYPENVSFWRDINKLYTMHKTKPYTFSAVIPASDLKNKKSFRYRIVLPNAGTQDSDRYLSTSEDITYPGAYPGNPLDWDTAEGDYYEVRILKQSDPLVLFNPAKGNDGMELSLIPDRWGRVSYSIEKNMPVSADELSIKATKGTDSLKVVLTKYIWPEIKDISPILLNNKELYIRFGGNMSDSEIRVSFVDRNGITFTKTIHVKPNETAIVSPSEMELSPTLLVPAPYPVFLQREYMPTSFDGELDMTDVEKVQIVINIQPSDLDSNFSIEGIWLN